MKQKQMLKGIVAIVLILSVLLPSTSVMAAISSAVEETSKEQSVEYEDSEFYLAHANVQVEDGDYYPVTADRLTDERYDYLTSNEHTNGQLRTTSDVVGDPMVFYAQRWLNQEYGSVSGFGSVTENGRTGWDVVYGLLRALQYELGITSLSNNFGN